MIVYALTTDDCTPPLSTGHAHEIDRRESWQRQFLATVGRVPAQAAYTSGLRVHNWIMWRSGFGRVPAKVTSDAGKWLAERPAVNVVKLARRRG